MSKKLALVGSIVLLVGAFFFFDLQHYLSLSELKAQQQQLALWQNQMPLVFIFGYLCIYIIAAALSFPGATVLTLAGGALFGVVQGSILVSFASSLGATLAFLLSRYVLREGVQQKFGDKLSTLNAGIEKNGAFYLLTLRLAPIFPFFIVNLLMGLTPIRVLTFYGISQLGMLPATIVYVNAGTQLSKIDSLSGIVSPGLLLSFGLLAIFPLLTQWLLASIQRRRVYSRWQKPKRFDRNLIVIGAGAAGLVTSYIAAAVKAKVTLIEAHKMGGDCLNYGCVPSKALIKSAKLAAQIQHAERYGLEGVYLNDKNLNGQNESGSAVRINFKAVMARVHRVIEAVAPHDSVERYTNLGVEVLSGYAQIIDPWTVEISLNNGEKTRLTSRSIVIAAGARPFVPPLPGINDVGYVTSDTLWQAFAQREQAPKRLIVLGGGPIGCELAQCFARLGSQVSQIEMSSRILVREDVEVSALALASLQADGVQVLTAHKALRCEKQDDRKFLLVEHQGVELRLEFDELICAVGRVARLDGYGLEALGIPTQRTVVVNEYLQTLYPNIYAAGDVAGPFQFTHTAAHQAWYAAVNALFGGFKKFKVDYSVIPWTTFIDPEVARVGLNEQEAMEKKIPYEVTRYHLDDLDRAIADSSTQGFVKVLTVPGKDKILGVTIVGVHAGDLLAEFVLAMKHGLGLNKILGTIHTYPTLAEANKYVAGEWKRAHAPQKVLQWVKRFHDWQRG